MRRIFPPRVRVTPSALVNAETQEPGKLNALFWRDADGYHVCIFGEKPLKRGSRTVVVEYSGTSIRKLAGALRDDGFVPPRALGRLCTPPQIGQRL